MKAKRLNRNRTRRRIQRGGYSIDNMLENIRIINESTKDNFQEGRKNLKELEISVNSPDFKEAVDRSEFPDKDDVIRSFLNAVRLIGRTTDRKIGPGGGQLLSNHLMVFNTLIGSLFNLKRLIESLSKRVVAPARLRLPQQSTLESAAEQPLPPSPSSVPQAPPPPPPLALAEPAPELQAPPVEAFPSPPAQEPVEEAAQPVGEPQPEEEAPPAEIPEEEFEDDDDEEEPDTTIQDLIRKQFPGSGDETSLDFLKKVHDFANQDKLKQTKDWVVATTRRAIEFAASRCNSKDAAIVNRRKKVLLDLLATFNDKYTDEQFAQKVRLVLRTTIQAVKSANQQSGISNTGTSFRNENELSRKFVRELIYLMISRNQRELRFRTVNFAKLIYKSFHREPWCYKQDLSDVTKQEFLKNKLGAKWIDGSKQGLLLTSKTSARFTNIPETTMTISRGDCFSITPTAFKDFFPGNKYFIDLSSQKNNHFLVSNITELPIGFSLTIFNATSGSIVKSSRLELKLTNYSQINLFMEGINKKDCPKGVGLTPVLPDDCPKKLFTSQIKLVGETFKSRGLERRATTCETELARLRAELTEMTEKNKAETEKLQASIAQEQLKLKGLQDSKTEVEQNLRAANTTVIGLRDYVDVCVKDLGKFRTKADGLQREKDKLDAQIGVLTADKEKSAEESASLIATREAEIARLTGLYAGIMSQLAESVTQQSKLEQTYRETNSKLVIAEASVADLNSRFATTDALIANGEQKILAELGAAQEILTEGVEEIEAGLNVVAQLAKTTQVDIENSRLEFNEQFKGLQRNLEASTLAGRDSIVEAIRVLREDNQRNMTALQADLASASAERVKLEAQLSEERAAKAKMQGELDAKNQEIERKDREHREAVEGAKIAAATAAEQLKAAQDNGQDAAELERLTELYEEQLEKLSNALNETLRRAQAAERKNAEIQPLTEEIARVRAQIASLPPPVVVPPPAIAPEILGRDPEGNVRTGSVIQIRWDPKGTTGPWILRVDYDGFSDFQEVTAVGPITYTVKRPGALSGRIYSVTLV